MKKIIVLTSGGDAPGMNAAIRAVVRSGHFYGLKVYGCQLGFQGLVEKKIFPLEPESVANCIQHGGTILQTGRYLNFLQKDVRTQCLDFLHSEKIDGIVVIGGNGSFKGASLLSSEGGPAIIGIPGTIDNDIPGTEYTIGFDTARNTALHAIDKIRDTASSHNRLFLVEVMGRSSGFLAVDVGLAGGAEFILTPEFPFTMPELASKIMKPRREKLSSIIVIAEADEPGRSIQMAKELDELTGLQYRVCILGHTQRGGSPTLLDRKVALSMGNLAVKGLIEGKSHKMTAIVRDELMLVDIPDPDHGSRVLLNKYLLELNDVLCS
ncbi:MAG: 6-phosphofructokinase [Gammaproteobacteria bacterium]|nr:6-phosphofructokinase [Gammaproteobacteria bacterium]